MAFEEDWEDGAETSPSRMLLFLALTLSRLALVLSLVQPWMSKVTPMQLDVFSNGMALLDGQYNVTSHLM